jgi:hypothetical protein
MPAATTGQASARRARVRTTVLLAILVLAALPAAPALAAPVAVMPVGDSVTAGGTAAADTYRYRLYQHYASSGVDWAPVGPFQGVSATSQEPAVGYGAWPQAYTRHAGFGGRSVAALTPDLTGWVRSHTPDVVLAFPAFIDQGSVTQAQLEAFIDAARAGRSDVKMLFGSPYEGSPFTAAETAQYRSRLAAAVAAKTTAQSPIHIVDMSVGWLQAYHGGGGTQGRYPAEPAGNRRVAMRWADALHTVFGIGAPWPAAQVQRLTATSTGLSWAFDDRADTWQVERNGRVVATVTSVPGRDQQVTLTEPGTYRVRGRRTSATTPSGNVVGAWSATIAYPSQRFPDVPPTNTHYTSIDWLASEGVTEGFPDGTFRPAALVTRRAMAAFLYRRAGSPAGPFPNPGFRDVGVNHRYAKEIAWLASQGIAEGFGDGTFRPGAPVTRRAMASFLYRADGAPAG